LANPQSPNESQVEDSGKHRKKCPEGGRDKDKDDKKPTNGKFQENSKFDNALKAAKQKVEQAHGQTYLGLVIRAAGKTIPETLSLLGIPEGTCRRFVLWGGCRDTSCTLTHDETKLNPTQLSRAMEIINEGGSKLKKSPRA